MLAALKIKQVLTITFLIVATTGMTQKSEPAYPIAGINSDKRPQEAPVITKFFKNTQWYEQALHGVYEPYPSSLQFLEDQGAWHTPFNRPGFKGAYDIRNWYD